MRSLSSLRLKATIVQLGHDYLTPEKFQSIEGKLRSKEGAKERCDIGYIETETGKIEFLSGLLYFSNESNSRKKDLITFAIDRQDSEILQQGYAAAVYQPIFIKDRAFETNPTLLFSLNNYSYTWIITKKRINSARLIFTT